MEQDHPPDDHGYRSVSVSMNGEQIRELDAAAQEEGLDRSSFIRMAVKRTIREQHRRKQPA